MSQNTPPNAPQKFHPGVFRLWAIIASLFAVFNVMGAGLSSARDDADTPCGYNDCVDETAPAADQRRRHSDVM